MTLAHLLDANALIALTVSDHEHHPRAAAWAAGIDRIVLCPVLEGSLARFLIRLGQPLTTATTLLDRLYAGPRCELWPDALSYRDADLSHVIGHKQVTDAYLCALAASRGGRLATFDKALAQTDPADVVLIQ